MERESPDYTPPSYNTEDRAKAAIRVTLSAIPVIGGPAAEAFAYVFAPAIERRREQWMREVAEALARLEIVDEKLKRLTEDESFVSTVMEASVSAIRTHQVEKRAALRNAVLNSAVPGRPDDSLRQAFV